MTHVPNPNMVSIEALKERTLLLLKKEKKEESVVQPIEIRLQKKAKGRGQDTVVYNIPEHRLEEVYRTINPKELGTRVVVKDGNIIVGAEKLEYMYELLCKMGFTNILPI